MRIVDRKTFLALPEGAIYSKVQPAFFDGLYVKGATLPNGNDWYMLDLIWIDDQEPEDMDAFFYDHKPFPLNEGEGRDGLFDQAQLFAIYEPNDLRALRYHIDRALEAAEGTTHQPT